MRLTTEPSGVDLARQVLATVSEPLGLGTAIT